MLTVTQAINSLYNKINATKQDKLTAGSGITISGNTISATGGGGNAWIVKSDPLTVTAMNGTDIDFVCGLTGDSYRWQYTITGASWGNISSTPGYNTNTLTITAAASRNGYRYRCKVTNGDTVTYSDEILFIVNQDWSTAISGKADVGASYTKTESDGRYLTEHQDISGKADAFTVGTGLQLVNGVLSLSLPVVTADTEF